MRQEKGASVPRRHDVEAGRFASTVRWFIRSARPIGAVSAPPSAAAVFTTPRDSISITRHSCAANGRCSTLLGTTNSSSLFRSDLPVAEGDRHLAVDDGEDFVGLFVAMPDERILELRVLELVVVHLGDDLRAAVLGEQRALLREVNRSVAGDVFLTFRKPWD